MKSEQIPKEPADTRKEGFSDVQRLLLEKRMRGLTQREEQDPIGVRDPGAKVPLSAEQRRVWLHASQRPDLAIYNEPITIYRFGHFQLETFEAAFNEVVRRHEAWRTYFNEAGEGVVVDALQVKLPFLDLSELPEGEREPAALRAASANAQTPIALDHLPLFRGLVVRISAEEHRLYLTLHHIIFDGLSLSRILVPELSAIYAAFEEGRPSPLPQPTLQYSDYAIWRERQLELPSTKKHLKFWVEELSGELPVLRLPTDRPRPPAPSHRGSMLRFDVSSELREKLRALGRAHGVTLYTTLLAAYGVLLFRYSSQTDLIIGSATDARRRSQLEHVMGYFLDTVPVRTHPNATTTFSEYLAQMQDRVLEAFANADVPFDRIVHELNPKRTSSHHPIFQAFFTMRPVSPPFAAGWDIGHIDVAVDASKFDLYLELGEQTSYIEGRILFNTDIFDTATIDRMREHFLNLLEAICASPAEPLGSLSILSQAERDLLIGATGWNATAQEFPQVPLQTLIAKQVLQTPDALALVHNNEQFTYRQLSERSDAIAQRLRDLGVQQQSVVVVALERSADLLASLLAVHRLRAIYLPLDIFMPKERVSLCLEDSSPSAIVTEDSLLDRFSKHEIPTLLVEEVSSGEVVKAQDWPRSDALDDSAYVIYTSGTTGMPKAVEISQRSLVNLLTSMQRAPGFRSSDVLLALTAVSFDIAALELFLPLITGGTVVMATREQVLDPHLLTRAIEDSKCTVVQATPATWRTLLRSGWRDGMRAGVADSVLPLRVLCGGEALTPELAEQLLGTGAEVWNFYGPTETTIWSMIHRVTLDSVGASGSVSVGKPIANTEAYVLDPQLELAPLGVQGELYLGGEGLAKGYRGRPQQTAEKFLSVKAVGGARLYRTGDLAVRRPSGDISVLGRTDNQVKVRGYRVELEAVEAHVLRHPQVSAAAARVWPEATGDMRLSVYVVGKDDHPPTLGEMRSFLASHIPSYMIPSDVIPLERMPLSSNGKTDRSQLPAPTAATPPVDATQDTGTTLEEKIRILWAEMLNVQTIGLDDDFFSLGGHSVLVAALQQKLNAEFVLKVPMSELFHQPTVRLQAELIERLQGARTMPAGVLALQRQGRGHPIFWIHFANENLAKAVGEDQPFYSVVLTPEDVELLGEQPTLRSIAKVHMDKILATKPQGPYLLGGFCVGGVLAYEVAILMRDAGHEVPLLIMVDSPRPNANKARRVVRYLQWVSGTGGLRAIAYTLNNRINDYHGYVARKTAPKTEMRTAQEMVERAAAKYRPTRYEGDVVLIQASERLHMDLLPPWQEVITKGLRTQYVDGHHDDLMKAQNVQDVGRVMRAYTLPKSTGAAIIPAGVGRTT